MNSKTERFAAVEIGQVVNVTQRYMGDGKYQNDGNEGAWYVAGKLGPMDLKLVRHWPADPSEWEVIIHGSRVKEIGG